MQHAYLSCLSANGRGTGQSIGLYIPSPDNWLASDIALYAQTEGLGSVTVSTSPPNSGGTKAVGLEPVIDIEMAAAMAPAAQIVVFRQSIDAALQAMAASPQIKQFSSSYFPTLSQTGMNALNEMALQGQSFYEASGDSGSLLPNFAAADVRSQPTVTNVGGTILSMNGAGVSYLSETVWTQSNGGTSGWVLFNGTAGAPIPSYQAGLATAANGASPTYRNVPDVAMVGKDVLVYLLGKAQSAAGTSVAAPLWAGFTALINQEAAAENMPSLGFANPTLYHLARMPVYSWLFNDITTGTSPNTASSSPSFSATPGYDLDTGIGSPKCGLISALAGPYPVVNPTTDVVWRTTSGHVDLWRMRDSAIAASGSVDLGTITSDWVFKGTGDFNGDGQGDILWENSAGTTETWELKNGSPYQYVGTGSASSAWSVQGIGDFTGDGTSDILWRNTSGSVEIWRMNAGVPSAYLGLPSLAADWVFQGAGDFNGDGTTDILWRQASTGNTSIWQMQNGALATTLSPGSATSDWSIQGVGDFNGDGTSDILWRNTSGGLEYWQMASGAASGYVGIGSAISDWVVQSVGDFNDDGVSDILWRQTSTGSVQIWQMQVGLINYVGVGTEPSSWKIQGTLPD